MRAFAITFGPGPGWDPALPRREQREWDAHAAFMDGLVEKGFVLLGGPVGDGDRVLVAVEAVDEDAVRARFAADPWEPLGILRIERLEPWSLWLDARRGRGS